MQVIQRFELSIDDTPICEEKEKLKKGIIHILSLGFFKIRLLRSISGCIVAAVAFIRAKGSGSCIDCFVLVGES